MTFFDQGGTTIAVCSAAMPACLRTLPLARVVARHPNSQATVVALPTAETQNLAPPPPQSVTAFWRSVTIARSSPAWLFTTS